MDLDAIEMVLLAAISAGRPGAGQQPAAIDGLQAVVKLFRRQAGAAADRQHPDLPDQPGARRGIGSPAQSATSRIDSSSRAVTSRSQTSR